MTVYVEYVLLDNFCMDCILLYLSCATLKLHVKRWRLICGAAVGAITATCSVFVNVLVVPYKLLCLVATCVTVVGFGKKFFWYLLAVLAYTFAMGGAIIGIFHLLDVQYYQDGTLYYNLPVPLFVYFLGVFFVAFASYFLYRYVANSKITSKYMLTVEVFLDKGYKVSAFCDSGNNLQKDGIPVCFVTKKFSGLKEYFAQAMICGKVEKVIVCTVTGCDSVLATKCNVIVRGKQTQIYLALPKNKCNTSYNLLLNSCFCMEEL